MTRLFHDYETFSFVDLKTAGLSRYLRDSSTRALMLAWAFDDGPVQQWVEGDPFPREVEEALQDPEVIKSAWNAQFEWGTTNLVLGIDSPIEQYRCSMVHAMTLSFPGALDKVGEIVRLPQDKKKLSRGKALVKKFCGPQKPTKARPDILRTAETDPEDWEEFLLYNRQDVEAERAIWRRIRKYDMPEHEWDLWHLDQKINWAGIPINRRAVEGAHRICREYTEAAMKEMRKLTGLDNPNSTAQLLPWLQERGYRFEDLKKGHVKTGRDEAQDKAVKRVLTLRSETSKSSVKKFPAILSALDDDDMLRCCFQFAGAQRTWRWAGRRLQPQNLARPAWYLEKMQPALADAAEDLGWQDVEAVFGPPITAMSSAIRPMVQALPGYTLLDVDLNAIENRVLGWMADDRKILAVFEEDRCPYLDFGTRMFGGTYDELWHEYKVLGKKQKRTESKPAVLGCFAAETPVLTNSGWKAIVEVSATDLLFDGHSWVSHGGVARRGLKFVLSRFGIHATPDHKMLVCGEWLPWQQVFRPMMFRQAIATASGLLSATSDRLEVPAKFSGAAAGAASRGTSPAQTSSAGSLPDALDALLLTVAPTSEKESALACSTFSQIVTTLRNRVAKTRAIPLIRTTEGGEFVCGSRTLSTGAGTLSMISAQTDPSKLTVETMTATTSAETFDSLLDQSKTGIRDTWDVVDAGPLRRFFVLTESGPIVAHNCGYMLSGGDEFENEKTGEIEATGLLGYAWNMGIKLTRNMAHKSVSVWRETYETTVEYWWELDKAFRRVIRTGEPQRANHLVFDTAGPFVRMRLPSGRHLHYCRPKLEMRKTPWGKVREQITYENLNDQGQWVRVTTHPGKIMENGDQAIARDLLAHGMMLAHREGLDIRLHVHDQVVPMVPESTAERDLAILKQCLTTQPSWAPDMPLGAGGHISRYFIKD